MKDTTFVVITTEGKRIHTSVNIFTYQQIKVIGILTVTPIGANVLNVDIKYILSIRIARIVGQI